jgi:carbonic anhydrase
LRKLKVFIKETFTLTMNLMTLFQIILLFTIITQLAAVGWDYEAKGPDSWFRDYEKCSGNIQSPINIDDENGITYDKSLLPFVLGNYETPANFNITNNGETGFVKKNIFLFFRQ